MMFFIFLHFAIASIIFAVWFLFPIFYKKYVNPKGFNNFRTYNSFYMYSAKKRYITDGLVISLIWEIALPFLIVVNGVELILAKLCDISNKYY